MTRVTRVAWLAAGVAAWAPFLVACGGSPARAGAAAPARTAPAASLDALGARDGGAATAATGDALPSLDALAARGPTDAPLMREAMRVDPAAPRSPDVRADHDVCLRATFAASRTARAWFADATGAPRGDTTTAASGTVPPRGPVCAKKGETMHLVIEDAPSGANGASAPSPPTEASAPNGSNGPSASSPLVARAVVFTSP